MTFTKHMVLIGGVLALVAFFLPYGTASVNGVKVRVSAFEVVKGIDSIDQISNIHGNSEINQELAASTDNSTTKGYTMLVFGPPLLLLLLGGAAMARKKFQRLGGVGALLLGGWALLFGIAILQVLGEDKSENAGAGAGLWLFIAAGGLGALAGLLALIKPDRGTF